MEERCFEGMARDRDLLIEDFGSTITFRALSADGRVWLEDVPGERQNDVLVIKDRSVAAQLVRELFTRSGLKFRISCGAELSEMEKFELFRAAVYGPATHQ